MDESFVPYLITCNCDTELEIHGQYSEHSQWQARHTVNCPKCSTEHEIRTKALRLFYMREDKVWRTGELSD